MGKFLKVVTSKVLWINVLAVILFFVIALFVLMFSLRSCTNHGETVTIPTLVGINVDEAITMAENEGFVCEVIDTLIIDSLPKGVVVEQSPAKESQVKVGRTIYIKINTATDVYIDMPDFRGMQYKTLAVELQNKNLKLGTIKYKKDKDIKNIVLEQNYNGREIKPGTQIKRGSRIDFVIAGKDPNSKQEDEEEGELVDDDSDFFDIEGKEFDTPDGENPDDENDDFNN